MSPDWWWSLVFQLKNANCDIKKKEKILLVLLSLAGLYAVLILYSDIVETLSIFHMHILEALSIFYN